VLYGSSTAPPIGDYGIIGDCRSAALVSKAGSLDWLCWPWFHSPTVFGALLDTGKGGFWRIAPVDGQSSTRRYLSGTNVLETTFTTSTGTLRLIDCMPVYAESYQREHLVPDREVLRIAECVDGEVTIESLFAPAPKFGACRCRWTKHKKFGVRVEYLGGALWLSSDQSHELGDKTAALRTTLRAGERCRFSLTLKEHGPAVLSPLGETSDAALEQTIQWWQAWSAQCEYKGRHADAVLRSALTLKLLEFAPSGALVAAPTSSLPERIGGDLNWDYRFCWLRDASMTVTALFGLGYHAEADAFIEWLLHTTRLSQPRLRIMYTVYGLRAHKERNLDDWSGYRGSRPVRMGNGARDQLQLDVFGEVIAATAQVDEYNKSLDRSSEGVLRDIGDFVRKNWRTPDKGIWEPRGEPLMHTHSQMMCWVAMQALLDLREAGLLRKLDTEAVRRARDEIRAEIESRGWNENEQSYAAVFNGKEVDASLLLLAKHGFAAADSPRMRSTWERIRRDLRAGPGLYYRYRDNLSPGEGAFGICCFWAVDYLALGGGTLVEADDEFDKVLRYGNDLGLFAEEIDPATGAALGNFPQGFTHVGLINAALTIEERRAREAKKAA
jgi:GH15 family glucan-1,4-alpha-glucosidase